MESETERWLLNWLIEYMENVKQTRAALEGINLKMSVLIQKMDEWEDQGGIPVNQGIQEVRVKK